MTTSQLLKFLVLPCFCFPALAEWNVDLGFEDAFPKSAPLNDASPARVVGNGALLGLELGVAAYAAPYRRNANARSALTDAFADLERGSPAANPTRESVGVRPSRAGSPSSSHMFVVTPGVVSYSVRPMTSGTRSPPAVAG